jgi:phosphoglycerate dehydrogenase-like enzyme
MAFDPFTGGQFKKKGVEYVALEGLLFQSDIISLHCLLNQIATILLMLKV